MKEQNVVQIYEDVPRAGTFLIAQGFDREHKMLTKLIEKYREDFEEFGTLKVRKVMTKGRPAIEFWLNEEQSLLLGTYMRNNLIVREFKKKLIHEFKRLKDSLNGLGSHKQDPTYQITREAGKMVRKETTDVMQKFVEYAAEQGSKSANMYYMNITKMMNGLLFIAEGKFKNFRDVLTTRQLMTVSSAEQIINKTLFEGMSKNIFYKEIYKEVKSKVMLFAEIHGQSKVIDEIISLGSQAVGDNQK